MELSEFKKLELRPVEADFHGLKVVVNVNAITGRHFREAADEIRLAENAQREEAKRRLELDEKRNKLELEIMEIGAVLKNETDADKRNALQAQMDGLAQEVETLKPSTIEIFEGRGKETEVICDLYAKLIKGSDEIPVLISWDLTHEGAPVACTVEELRKRHPELLKELYECCVRVDRPKLPETPETATNGTISGSTVATSRPRDTQTDTSLTM